MLGNNLEIQSCKTTAQLKCTFQARDNCQNPNSHHEENFKSFPIRTNSITLTKEM